MSDKVKNEYKKYWRSLEQLADNPEYRQKSLSPYHANQEEQDSGLSRRNFLTLMSASFALASLAGCRRPVEKIIPYVAQPEEITPGLGQYYATTMPCGTSAIGILVHTREGRPIKIEGNPDHPSSQGATDFITQASLLNLYDPDRSKKVRHHGAEDRFDNFISFWREQMTLFAANKGRGLAVLSETFSSPTLNHYRNEFIRTFPEARWVCWEPVSDENIFRAVDRIAGQGLRPLYHFDRAEVILALDSDFLLYESDAITAARGFAKGRRVLTTDDRMNRLYVVESNFTVTGAMADHRLRLKSRQVGHLLMALGKELKKLGLNIDGIPETSSTVFGEKWLSALAHDLVSNREKSLIVAGRRQPPPVHEMVIKLNEALGNIGATLTFRDRHETTVPNSEALNHLVTAMNNGGLETLIILGGNPVYNTPADLKFSEALTGIKNSVHLSSHVDETSQLSAWHIPRAHYLESWGDAVSSEGTYSVIQPMIEPLFGGYSDAVIFAFLATGLDKPGYDIVRDTWKNLLLDSDFEKKWRQVLHDGLYKSTPLSDGKVSIKNKAISPDDIANTDDELEINFYFSSLYDGRFANNGWLQELPEAITRLTWDNAALISPATAKRLRLKNGEMIKIDYKEHTLEIPVWICPGNADNTIALPLGYGRTGSGRIGNGAGFNTYLLRTSDCHYFGSGAKITKTNKIYELANTQDHNRMEGRPIIREATLEEYRRHPNFAKEIVEHPPLKSLYPDHDYSKGYQWGMVIDLNICIGCNACTLACQSENNIQIVGKEQVVKGRELHWLRNDRYYVGDIDTPKIVYQPVPCQQCENAPCEQVCPVAATVHDSEGLNNMTYNRCIGTRYCSNNCPYKVRRFNFFNYINKLTEIEKMAQNPNVSMRSRGVMEKCTFCLQRIKTVKTRARLENRAVTDGEIKTACQQVCPTQAIQFGNINDPSSQVARLKKTDRNYELLAEYNIRPRNSYLAKLRNPNPRLKDYKPETG